MAVSAAYAQRSYEVYTGFALPENVALPAAEEHPSLYFRTSELGEVRARRNRARAAGGTLLTPEWNALDTEQNAFKKQAVPSEPDDRARYAKSLAFRWQVANDVVARDLAVAALVRLYEGVPQTGTPEAFASPQAAFNRATWLQNYCAAYDWLASVLTDAQRDTVRVRLGREADLLRAHMTDGVRYARRPQNIRLKAAYAIGTAALTLSSDPRAEGWLRFALVQQNTVTRYQFSADGLYREGPHYLNFVLVNGLPFLWQMRRLTALDPFPAYTPVFEGMVRLRGVRGLSPPFEDGYPRPMPAHAAAPAYLGTPTDLHRTAPLAHVLQWHWSATVLPTRAYTGATNDVTWDLDVFLLADDRIPAAVPTASPVQRLASGRSVLRDRWSGSDTRVLVFGAPAEGDNHQHPDRLAYHVEALDAVLAPDAGYGPAGAADARRAWYTSVAAHNTVSVNEGPTLATDALLNASETPGVLAAWLDAPHTAFAAYEAPDHGVPGSGTLTRAVWFAARRYWMVYDAADGNADAAYALRIHGRGSYTAEGEAGRWKAPADRYGSAADLAVAVSGPGRAVAEAGWLSLGWGHEEAHAFLTRAATTGAPAWLHALVPLAPASSAPTFAARTEGTHTLLDVHDGQESVAARAAPTVEALAVGRASAVARWVWQRDNTGSTVEVGAFAATHLALDGRPLLDAPTAFTASVDLALPDRIGVAMFAHGPVVAYAPHPEQRIVRVERDGLPVDVEAGEGGGVVLPGSGVYALFTATGTAAPALATPASVFRIVAQPSPFRTHTRIVVPGLDGPRRIRISDVLGRTVLDAVTDGPLVWDGRTPDGLAVGPGFYVVRVETPVYRLSHLLLRLP